MSLGQKSLQINLVADKQIDTISRGEGEEKPGIWNTKTRQLRLQVGQYPSRGNPHLHVTDLVISGFATYSPWDAG